MVALHGASSVFVLPETWLVVEVERKRIPQMEACGLMRGLREYSRWMGGLGYGLVEERAAPGET